MGWRHGCEGRLVRWGLTGIERIGMRYALELRGSHETVWHDTLVQSRAVRTALRQQHPAHRQYQMARETLAACHKQGVELRAHRGAFGVGQIAIAHRERATVPLLRAIEQQSVMLAMLLLDKAEAQDSEVSKRQAPVQGRLF